MTKTRQALLCMVAFCIPNIAGTITLLIVAPTPSTRGGLIVAFYAMQFFQAVRSVSSGKRSPLTAVQSQYLLDAGSKLGRTDQEIHYLRRDLYVFCNPAVTLANLP